MRQGDVKRKGADLLVAPLKLNVRLSKCGPRSVGRLRRLVKRRNLHPLRDLVDEVVGLFPAQARVGDRLAKDAAIDRLVAVLQVGLDHKALAISFAHFFVGLTCIISQRNILKQIFGYCLMENGSHVTLALLAPTAPEIIEIGIATDAIFAVIIMSAVVVRIWNDTKSLDSHDLTELKG